MHTSHLKKVGAPAQHWPDPTPEHFECTLIGAGDQTFEADLHKTEVKILQFLDRFKEKFTEAQRTELLTLIDDYGQRKYEDGGNSEAAARDED